MVLLKYSQQDGVYSHVPGLVARSFGLLWNRVLKRWHFLELLVATINTATGLAVVLIFLIHGNIASTTFCPAYPVIPY